MYGMCVLRRQQYIKVTKQHSINEWYLWPTCGLTTVHGIWTMERNGVWVFRMLFVYLTGYTNSILNTHKGVVLNSCSTGLSTAVRSELASW